jgi:hypothetical protein
MNTNFARLLPFDQRSTVETPPPPLQAPTFATPPSLPHSLSPIPETTTPAYNSGNRSRSHNPPNFGKLTLEKLPHPQFPPNSHPSVTHIPPITIYTESPSLVTTTHPLQSRIDHVFQYTNPSTSPNLYQPHSPHYHAHPTQPSFPHSYNSTTPSFSQYYHPPFPTQHYTQQHGAPLQHHDFQHTHSCCPNSQHQHPCST